MVKTNSGVLPLAELITRPHWISDKGELRFNKEAGQRLGDALPQAIVDEAKRKAANKIQLDL